MLNSCAAREHRDQWVKNSQCDCKVNTPGALQCLNVRCVLSGLGTRRWALSESTVRATLRFERCGRGVLSHDIRVLVNQNCVLVQFEYSTSFCSDLPAPLHFKNRQEERVVLLPLVAGKVATIVQCEEPAVALTQTLTMAP